MTVFQVCFDFPAKFQSIHHRHHDIADHQLDTVLFKHFQRFFSIVRLADRIA